MADGGSVGGVEVTADMGCKAVRCWPKGPPSTVSACGGGTEEDDHE